MDVDTDIEDRTMKIDQHEISLAASRMYDNKTEEHEELREWGVRSGHVAGLKMGRGDHGGEVPRNDQVTISREARMAMNRHAEHISASDRCTSGAIEEESQGMDPRLMALKRMIEAMTGREIRLGHVNLSPDQSAAQDSVPTQAAKTAGTGAPAQQEWGMRYTYTRTFHESETTTFSASGTVVTADGQHIAFTLDLMMNREYSSHEQLEITAGAPMIDPIVINFDGSAAELEDMSFEFDLNSDGTNENLHTLAPGSGFLVFDKNNDGIVNNGSELFGPASGDGFSELSAHDKDGNHWIDENDWIYDKLSVWRRENSRDVLMDLKNADVGAIYLGNAKTVFDLADTENALLGRICKTGIYLKEDGGMGTVQQIDYSI